MPGRPIPSRTPSTSSRGQAQADRGPDARRTGRDYQVCIWLRWQASSPPAPDAIERRTNWLRLLQPFEYLAGDDQFRGRVKELQQLRSYAGVLPPGSLLESVHRAFEETFGSSEKPPLLITGPGGVGNSTLWSRFILEHARALEVERSLSISISIVLKSTPASRSRC
jgi:hypothetical protein